MVMDMARVWKIHINDTYEVVQADNPADAVREAVKKYLGQIPKEKRPDIIEVHEVYIYG